MILYRAYHRGVDDHEEEDRFTVSEIFDSSLSATKQRGRLQGWKEFEVSRCETLKLSKSTLIAALNKGRWLAHEEVVWKSPELRKAEKASEEFWKKQRAFQQKIASEK